MKAISPSSRIPYPTGGLSVGDRQRGGERGALGKLRERIADKGKPKVPSVVRAAQQLEDVGAWQAGDLDALSDDGAPGGGGTHDGLAGGGRGGRRAGGGNPFANLRENPLKGTGAGGREGGGGGLARVGLPALAVLALVLALALAAGRVARGSLPVVGASLPDELALLLRVLV